jgi:hypothetical protein
MKNIYNFLSSKKAAWLFTIIAIVSRTVNILYVSFTSRDKVFLALQSKSFLHGKGLSIPQYFSSDLANPIYDLTPRWPPGYPILLAPFLKIFDYDLAAATTTIDLIGGIVLIFLARKIAIQLKFPPAAVNIVILIAGCFEYAFIAEALPTDISSFAFFLAGLLVILKAIQQSSPSTNKIIIASILLFIPCTFRYAYPPLTIAVPIAMILIGWHMHSKTLIKKGLLSFSIVSVLLIIFFISLKILAGKTGYIVDTGRGFYPENLLHCAPIAPGSFVNTFFTTSQLINKAGLSLSKSHGLLEIINVFMIIGLLAAIFVLFLKKKFFKQPDPFKLFLWIGFFVSAATFVSLAYLSVTYKPQPGWGNYLGEPRYFMFVSFYLQMIFIGWVFLYSSWKKHLFQKILITVLSLLLFIEVAHNIYFYTKVALSPTSYRVAPYEEPDYTYFTHTLESLARENADAEFFIIAESDDFYPLMAAYLGHKGIYDGQKLVKGLQPLKKKTIIIFTLYDNELSPYEVFLKNKNAVLLDRVNGVNFYSVTLVP